MRKSSKEIRTQALLYIKEFGSTEKLISEISNSLQDLSTDCPMSNVNQIDYLVRILFYLRYEYNK